MCLVARAATGCSSAQSVAAGEPPSAEDGRSGSNSAATSGRGGIVGYALLSVTQPLALLPPPFPSTAPPQLHVDGLAVAAAQRRRGVGRALLASAERLARLWAWPSLWLHVDASNAAAVQLYSELGYTIMQVQRSGTFAQRRTLVMRKLVPPACAQRRAGQGTGASSSSTSNTSSTSSSSGGAAHGRPTGQHPNAGARKGPACTDASVAAPQAAAAVPAAASARPSRVYNWSSAPRPLRRGAHTSSDTSSSCATSSSRADE